MKFLLFGLYFVTLFTVVSHLASVDDTSSSQDIFYHNDEINCKVISIDIPEKEEPTEPKGRWVLAKVTAYTPWDAIDKDSGFQDGFTSTMKDTREHPYGIAADPSAIPYGTKIYVPGYYESILNNKTTKPVDMPEVDDTGGAMRKSWRSGVLHLDVRYRTTEAARNWGSKRMKVFIYDN